MTRLDAIIGTILLALAASGALRFTFSTVAEGPELEKALAAEKILQATIDALDRPDGDRGERLFEPDGDGNQTLHLAFEAVRNRDSGRVETRRLAETTRGDRTTSPAVRFDVLVRMPASSDAQVSATSTPLFPGAPAPFAIQRSTGEVGRTALVPQIIEVSWPGADATRTIRVERLAQRG